MEGRARREGVCILKKRPVTLSCCELWRTSRVFCVAKSKVLINQIMILLKFIIQELRKRHGDCVAVTAPTGIAAINVGGITIHSFSGIGHVPIPAEGNCRRKFGQEILQKVKKNARTLTSSSAQNPRPLRPPRGAHSDVFFCPKPASSAPSARRAL